MMMNNSLTGGMNQQQQQNSQQQPNQSSSSQSENNLNPVSSNMNPASSSSSSASNYSIPGILHYIQFEWQRFELDRQQWAAEKSELQARIALLQGERKGQENLKNDLVRRIRMLEYCLKQERNKNNKDGNQITKIQDHNQVAADEESSSMIDASDDQMMMLLNDATGNNASENSSSSPVINWKDGRQLLRQYLLEIGYTDTIIDVRSNRVRSLLGLNNNNNQNVNHNLHPHLHPHQHLNSNLNNNNNNNNLNNVQDQLDSGTSLKNNPPRSGGGILTDTEASVLATFDFLNQDSNSGSDLHSGSANSAMNDDQELDDDEDDSETEEVLAEFDFLSNPGVTNPGPSANPGSSNNSISGSQTDSSTSWRPDIVDIGELAALTVANESMDNMNGSSSGRPSSGISNSLNPEYRKTWNPRYILKSHFDCIRCLKFHMSEPLLVTCSEDETIKLWNLSKTTTIATKGGKGSNVSNVAAAVTAAATSPAATFDLEPVYTFRGHSSRVLTLVLDGNVIYSGSQSGEIFCWTIPDNVHAIDPYDPFDTSFSPIMFPGHANAVWSLLVLNHPSQNSSSKCPFLVSISSDNSLKLWDTSKRECIKSISFSDRSATCLAAIEQSIMTGSSPGNGSGQLVAVSFTDGSIEIYNLLNELTTSSSSSIISNSTLVPILVLKSTSEPEGSSSNSDLKVAGDMIDHPSKCCRINSIVVHPSMPILVSAHEDRQIKFWDLNSGKCLNAMVAHLDEVTSLACDPNGLYLLSGSHDCSVRLWNFENRTCVQEITSHRKKFDEAIHDVTFHPSKPFFASAGADGLAKVFV